jgi:hypothetical protein
MGELPSAMRVAVNILNKQPCTNDEGWSSSLGVRRGANNPLTVKNKFVTKNAIEPQTWLDSLDKCPKRQNMVMRFGIWNVRSLYRTGSLMTVSRELARYKLYLVGMQEVRWDGSGTEPAGEYTFFFLQKGIFVHKKIYQQLGWLSLSVIEYTKRSLVSCLCSERSCPNRR